MTEPQDDAAPTHEDQETSVAVSGEAADQPWTEDILPGGFQQRVLPLGADEEGEVVATLVRFAPDGLVTHGRPLDDVDVLYLHGWSDYFFQAELAEFWAGLGAHFYALDLRKYGRSLRPGQTPGYTTSLEVYDEDIRAALTVMGYPADGSPEHPRRLILVGHSTGGLTATLWASRHPGLPAALVLTVPGWNCRWVPSHDS